MSSERKDSILTFQDVAACFVASQLKIWHPKFGVGVVWEIQDVGWWPASVTCISIENRQCFRLPDKTDGLQSAKIILREWIGYDEKGQAAEDWNALSAETGMPLTSAIVLVQLQRGIDVFNFLERGKAITPEEAEKRLKGGAV